MKYILKNNTADQVLYYMPVFWLNYGRMFPEQLLNAKLYAKLC